MRRYIFICFLAVYSMAFGQQDGVQKTNDSTETMVKFHSFSLMFPLGFYYEGHSGGGAFDADLTFRYGKDLFTFMGGMGTRYGGLASDQSFRQYNALYGREFQLSERAFLEIHVGVGGFTYKSPDINTDRHGTEQLHTVGFPILGKIRAHTGPSFSLGLKAGVNINSAKTLAVFGFFIQWNSKKD